MKLLLFLKEQLPLWISLYFGLNYCKSLWVSIPFFQREGIFALSRIPFNTDVRERDFPMNSTHCNSEAMIWPDITKFVTKRST